jgi:hypothetical protein
MKIQDQDVYHGAALTQVVQHDSFKALNRASEKYGHYLVNKDHHMFVKYRTNRKSPWSFTLQADELAAIQAEIKGKKFVFLCLVCGYSTICALTQEELVNTVDVESSSSQWVRVTVPKGGSCRVTGSVGTLSKVIPHNSFPDKIFT